MYALFKDRKQITKNCSDIPTLWLLVIMEHPFSVTGVCDNINCSMKLEKGYTIEEVKE